MVAIIAIHTTPFDFGSSNEIEKYEYLAVIINQFARFAVPYFFIISGYFWGVKVRNGSDPLASALGMAKRIGIIFLAWCVIYLLPFNVSAILKNGVLVTILDSLRNIEKLIRHPLILFMQGTKIHLWYLVAFLFAIGINAVFVHKKKIKSLVALSVLLYIVGVLGKAYAKTPLGIDIGFDTRNGPFMGTLFFVTGYLMSSLKTNPKWFVNGILIFVAGIVIHFSEIYVLWNMFAISPKQDYVFGTFLMGVGAAMVGLSNHPALRSSGLSSLGRLSLGIYVIHYIYVDVFKGFDQKINGPIWEVSYVLIVVFLSVVSVMVLSKNKFLRKILI